MTNQEEKEMQLTVPYIMHEAAQARATQTIIYKASEQLFKHVKF